MNVLDLMARLGGEILGHKIRATIDGEIVVLAKLNDQNWDLTDQGQVLFNEHSNLVVAEAAAKTRKKTAAAVESVQVSADTVVGLGTQTAK
jgi:hypothetical protein